MKQKGVEKLKPRSYVTYKVTKQVGEVAYEWDLPPDSKEHIVFHVSSLKKALGQQVIAFMELSPMEDEGHLVLILEAILEEREKKL